MALNYDRQQTIEGKHIILTPEQASNVQTLLQAHERAEQLGCGVLIVEAAEPEAGPEPVTMTRAEALGNPKRYHEARIAAEREGRELQIVDEATAS